MAVGRTYIINQLSLRSFGIGRKYEQVVYSSLSGFTYNNEVFQTITTEQLASLSDVDYQHRIEQFLNYYAIQLCAITGVTTTTTISPITTTTTTGSTTTTTTGPITTTTTAPITTTTTGPITTTTTGPITTTTTAPITTTTTGPITTTTTGPITTTTTGPITTTTTGPITTTTTGPTTTTTTTTGSITTTTTGPTTTTTTAPITTTTTGPTTTTTTSNIGSVRLLFTDTCSCDSTQLFFELNPFGGVLYSSSGLYHDNVDNTYLMTGDYSLLARIQNIFPYCSGKYGYIKITNLTTNTVLYYDYGILANLNPPMTSDNFLISAGNNCLVEAFISDTIPTTTTTTGPTTTTTTLILDFTETTYCVGFNYGNIIITSIFGGNGSYFVGTTSFDDEITALSNTSWVAFTGSYSYPASGAPRIYWLIIKDSSGTLKTKIISFDCSGGASPTTTTTTGSITTTTTGQITTTTTGPTTTTTTSNLPVCDSCPGGYTAIPGGCYILETTAATAPISPEILVSKYYGLYSNHGTIIYSNSNVDGTGTVNLHLTSDWWQNNTFADGPLNRTALWSSTYSDNQKIGFGVCITAPTTKTYYIGVGSDNFASININGTQVLSQNYVSIYSSLNSQGYATDSNNLVLWQYWMIYPITLNAGQNFIEIFGNNYTGIAAVGIEVYDATASELAAVTSYTDLGAKLLFSTKDEIGNPVVIGDTIGWTCPDGYALVTCVEGNPYCAIRTDIPCAGTTTTTAPVTTTTTTAPATTTTTISPSLLAPKCFGLLYNQYVVSNIAPAGWHVPSKAEFDALSNYLGGNSVAGGYLKATGTTWWHTPNVGATNAVNFNAKGAGARSSIDGLFNIAQQYEVEYITSTAYNDTYYYFTYILNSSIAFETSAVALKFEGHSLRLIKDDPSTWTSGDMMKGNDNKYYPTVKINGVVWINENLSETKFNDGSLIPNITGNTEWANATSGALCAYNNDWNSVCLPDPNVITTTTTAPATTTTTAPITTTTTGASTTTTTGVSTTTTTNNYDCSIDGTADYYLPPPPSTTTTTTGPTTTTTTGPTTTTTTIDGTIYRPNLCAATNGLLYNYFATIDSRKITSDDNWVIPSVAQWNTLYGYVSNGLNEVGAKLKETGTVHWNSPNVANNYNWFNAYGSGWRYYGNYVDILNKLVLWTSSAASNDPTQIAAFQLTNTSLEADRLYTYGVAKTQGLSIRLVRSTTALTNRLTGQYVGNDNTVYNTICIGTQEWLSTNLNETKYRDGSNIDIVPDFGTWIGTLAGMACSYGNLYANASVCNPPPPIDFPEAFSPNGDGYNDYFVVKGIESYPYNKMYIFDRDSNLVFECLSDYGNHPWNGHLFNTGSRVPTGNYSWVLEMYYSSGQLYHKYKGFVYVGY